MYWIEDLTYLHLWESITNYLHGIKFWDCLHSSSFPLLHLWKILPYFKLLFLGRIKLLSPFSVYLPCVHTSYWNLVSMSIMIRMRILTIFCIMLWNIIEGRWGFCSFLLNWTQNFAWEGKYLEKNIHKKKTHVMMRLNDVLDIYTTFEMYSHWKSMCDCCKTT